MPDLVDARSSVCVCVCVRVRVYVCPTRVKCTPFSLTQFFWCRVSFIPFHSLVDVATVCLTVPLSASSSCPSALSPPVSLRSVPFQCPYGSVITDSPQLGCSACPTDHASWGGRARSCEQCSNVTCVDGTGNHTFIMSLPSIQALVSNGDILEVVTIAHAFPNGVDVNTSSLPFQIDATPPKLTTVVDVLPYRPGGVDQFHPAVTTGSKNASSNSSAVPVDVAYQANGAAVSCAFAAGYDPDSGMDPAGYRVCWTTTPQVRTAARGGVRVVVVWSQTEWTKYSRPLSLLRASKLLD